MGTETPQKQALIYTRISLDRADGAGVERQEQDCRRLAAEQGLRVTGVYCDNSVSAYSGVVRPAFQRLIDDARADDAAIIVWSVDRLFRRLRDLESLVEQLGDTPVLTVKSGDIRLDTADSRLHARLLAGVAQHSSEKSAERISAAARQRAEKGFTSTTSRPFGWRWIHPCPAGGQCEHTKQCARPGVRPAAGTRGRLEPDPVEALVVAEMYDRFVAGESLTGIAKWLNDRGVTAAQGSTFNQARVRQILAAPRHAGLSSYKGEILADTPNRDGAIVEPSVWWAAHRIMSDPTRLKRGPAPQNLLARGIAVCHKCGGPVVASSNTARGGGRKLTYKCRRGSHVQWLRERLDGTVTDIVLAYLVLNRDWLHAAREERLRAAVDAGDSAAADLQRLRSDRDGLAEALAAGLLSLGSYTAAARALDERISAAVRRLEPETPSQLRVLLDADDIVAEWHRLDVPRQRTVLAELVDKITVNSVRSEEKITVKWKAS